MDNRNGSCAVCVFCLLIVASIGIVLTFTGQFSSLLNFSVPEADLSVSVDKLHRILQSPDSSDGFTGNISTSSTTNARIIRKRKIEMLSRFEKIELGLAKARSSIRKAASARNVSMYTDDDFPIGDIYRNPAAFYQSYLEMEKKFKVFVYSEGEPPVVHDGPCKSIYAIEGRFILELELGSTGFRTMDPEAAHAYFLPFSVARMVQFIYEPNNHGIELRRFAGDYVEVISTKYPYWNRTNGADHFMLACHDWGPDASRGNPYLYNTSIRVLCNANTSEGFNPQKDVTVPEIRLYGGEVSSKLLTPPPQNASRQYLAFFAGGLHGPIRPILLDHWKSRDEQMPVFEYLPKNLDYDEFVIESKYCLCPSGYEVASPRVIEAIYGECVPVILSRHYVLPFSDVLKWEAFSLIVDVSEIPRLKEILMAVPEEKYLKLKEGLKIVRKHFELNEPAKRFDMFHMILHSIWLRRINRKLV